MGIAGLSHAAITIHVETGCHAGIGAQGKERWIFLTLLGQHIAQRPQGAQFKVIIDPLEHKDIRRVKCHDLRHGADLRIFAPQDVAQQVARAVAVQFDIVGGNSNGVGGGGALTQPERGNQGDQARCSPSASALA